MRNASARRTHAERSAETRERLLAATLAVVADGGVQAASMFEVAKAAGVTPGAVQHHFGTKAELMACVVERLVTDRNGSAVRWPSRALPLPRRARAYVEALWTGLYAPARFLLAWSVYFGALDDPELRARIGTQRQAVEAAMRERFLEVFPEAAGPGLADFVDLVLSTLRGIGVARLFDRSPRKPTAQLVLLAGIIEARCAAAASAHTAPRPARPPRARPTPDDPAGTARPPAPRRATIRRPPP
jgi:AcrR family transcriptional regulator